MLEVPGNLRRFLPDRIVVVIIDSGDLLLELGHQFFRAFLSLGLQDAFALPNQGGEVAALTASHATIVEAGALSHDSPAASAWTCSAL
jgi:hypothetical protein